MDKASENTLIETLLQERDEMYAELSKLRKIDNGALEKAEATIKEQADRIKKLTDQLAWYQRNQWQPSSEKHIPEDPAQRKIDFEGLDVLPEEQEAIEEAQKEILTYERKKPEKKKKPVRQPLPEHLRRETEVIEPEGIDEKWEKIGQEVTEILEFKPGEMYVRQIIRPKYVLKKEFQAKLDEVVGEQKCVTVAPLPLQPLPKSNAGSSLLAELHVGKYFYHLPFHRQLEMLKHAGIHLPASTVNDWFAGSCDLLRALYYRLQEEVLSSDYIQVDESTIPVISDKKKKAVKAYLWVVRSVMNKLVFFHYDKGSRSQKVVIELLKDFKGAVQTDGYDVYSIYENKKDVLLLSCWAHARRKYSEALKEDKSGAEYALEQIGMLYKVETMADEKGLNYEERAALRAKLAYPIQVAFEKWVIEYLPKTIRGGRMYRALNYTYKLLPRLSRYHLDGRYLPDNNLVENAIRPLAIGRKNFMFCGNHDAAENAAIMYSLLGTCRACGIDPNEWLTDVFTRIPDYNANYDLDLADLLPHNWLKSKNQEKSNQGQQNSGNL